MSSQSWKLGNPGSLPYRLFDQQRNWLNASLSNYLHAFVKDKHSIKILEAGSGPAMCASLLHEFPNVSETHALDIDPEVITLLSKRDPKINAQLGSLLKMPYADQMFDLVYNSSTIEHLEDSKTAFSEMVRVCKQDGIVFTGVPHKWGPLFPSLLFPEKGALREWVGRFISREEVMGWAKAHSLTLVHEKTYYFSMFKGYVFKRSAS